MGHKPYLGRMSRDSSCDPKSHPTFVEAQAIFGYLGRWEYLMVQRVNSSTGTLQNMGQWNNFRFKILHLLITTYLQQGQIQYQKSVSESTHRL